MMGKKETLSPAQLTSNATTTSKLLTDLLLIASEFSATVVLRNPAGQLITVEINSKLSE